MSQQPGSPKGLRYASRVVGRPKGLRYASLLLCLPAILLAQSPSDSGAAKAPQNDLDALMLRALARREASWKLLRQYVLDEREQFDFKDPSGNPIFGERREYTWYIRDGFFVRSPTRANGVSISEEERRKYEDEWIAGERRKEYRRSAKDGPPPPVETPPADAERVGDFLRQTIEPRFISAAYFMDFKFEPGNYALVGRESLEGRDVLRVEYYPTKLFTDDDEHEHREQADHATERSGDKDGKGKKNKNKKDDEDMDAAIERRMNKVSLITLWVEPTSAQIIRYTFDNVGLDFLPGRWLVRIDELKASMEMGLPFPDVWLPRKIQFRVAVTLATGTYPATFDIEYRDYRLADVTTKIKKVGP
jgi:hypothetical protein